MNRRLTTIIAVWLLYGCNYGLAQSTYTNPVRTQDGAVIRMADPFVWRLGGVYYMTGTTRQQSGFDLYTSPDLAIWTFAGEIYTKPEGHYGVAGFWAPEVFEHEGRFYLTYSAYNPHTRLMLTSLAVSDRPEGPYTDLYSPWFDFGYSAIDCHIFRDDDPEQSLYLYFSRNTSSPGFGAAQNYAVRLKPDLSGTEGEPLMITEADQAWEKVNWDHNRCTEGPAVFKHGDTYYMTYSGNHTGYDSYGIGYATARHPLGPWTKAEENPVMSTVRECGVIAPGHNSMVLSPDETERFIVYHRHADPEAEQPTFDRIVCIDRITVAPDGKLRIEGPTTTPQPLPSGIK